MMSDDKETVCLRRL